MCDAVAVNTGEAGSTMLDEKFAKVLCSASFCFLFCSFSGFMWFATIFAVWAPRASPLALVLTEKLFSSNHFYYRF